MGFPHLESSHPVPTSQHLDLQYLAGYFTLMVLLVVDAGLPFLKDRRSNSFFFFFCFRGRIGQNSLFGNHTHFFVRL